MGAFSHKCWHALVPLGGGKTVRIIFCDDEERVLQELSALVLEYFEENGLGKPEIALYSSGETLLEQETRRVEIAFLDVEMPGVSGIQIGAQLKGRNPYAKIFIVTSFADYLDEAMKFHVFRYLSKPVEKKRLFRNLKDALYQLSVDTRPVLIETAEGSATRYADEIIMAEAQGHKVLLYTVDRTYETHQNIRHWEQLLEIGSFIRTHRSFIINMKYVTSFSSNLITLSVPGGQEYTAYLARRRIPEFKSAYMLYVEAMR